MRITIYSSAMRYLEAHIHKTKDPHDGPRNVKRTKYLLKLLGNPQNQYPTIHIGGTSGKSSTAFFLAKILEKAGYKTGLTISPHLQVATERIQLSGRFASKKEFVALINKIKPVVERVERERRWGKVGYFQILLAAAFLYFAQKRAVVAVIEVGIGGHYDATNVIRPVLAIITNVGLDHINILGNTIEKIARDKREIIKREVPIITGATQKSVVSLLEEKAEIVDAPLTVVNTKTQKTYQDENMLLACRAAGELKKLGFAKITNNAIRHATRTAHFPGRLEIVGKNPLVILDGAHNPDKINALAKTLKNLFPNEKFTVLLADTHRQHHPKMLKTLAPLAQKIIMTRVSDGSRVFKKLLAKSSTHDNILITGSFFLVGKIRNLYYPDAKILQKRGYYT